MEPGVVAVIFVSTRTANDEAGYARMAESMESLAHEQEGFVGITSVRDPHTGVGISVSYWRDEACARAWKNVPEHRVAQERGRGDWYRDYSLTIAEVTRSYAWDSEVPGPVAELREGPHE